MFSKPFRTRTRTRTRSLTRTNNRALTATLAHGQLGPPKLKKRNFTTCSGGYVLAHPPSGDGGYSFDGGYRFFLVVATMGPRFDCGFIEQFTQFRPARWLAFVVIVAWLATAVLGIGTGRLGRRLGRRGRYRRRASRFGRQQAFDQFRSARDQMLEVIK